MQLISALAQYAGMTERSLFRGTPPLARIYQGPDGVTVPIWNVPNVAAPTAAQIAAFLEALDPAPKLLEYASAKQDSVLSAVWTFNAGTASSPLDLTTALDPRGETSMMKLLMWGQINAADQTATQAYSNVDYTTATLTPGQATSIGTQAAEVVSESYRVFCQLCDGIQAKTPTITTIADIDSAAWPTPTS